MVGHQFFHSIRRTAALEKSRFAQHCCSQIHLRSHISRICASALDEKLGRDGHSRTSVGANHHDNDNTDIFVSDRRQRLLKPLRVLRLLHFLDSSLKVIFCVKPRCFARLCGESLGHKIDPPMPVR